jgi:hypothetical protein
VIFWMTALDPFPGPGRSGGCPTGPPPVLGRSPPRRGPLPQDLPLQGLGGVEDQRHLPQHVIGHRTEVNGGGEAVPAVAGMAVQASIRHAEGNVVRIAAVSYQASFALAVLLSQREAFRASAMPSSFGTLG